LPPERERARYELHRNTPEDAGYIRFLQPVVECLKRRVPSGARVLDYGSGPAPVLAEWLNREGFRTVAYDPSFAPSADLTEPFDAVVSVETFEHFRQPRREVDRLARLLTPGGVLVAMTELWTPGRDFMTWHYASDDTHIAFYSETTFRFMAAAWGFRLAETDGKRLVVLAGPERQARFSATALAAV
jgi:2-polyprenyl-3-methyl-5-hydroxy-6-metoxy-1,4-benzoquinol methylase